MGLGEISIMIFLSLAFFIYTLFLCFHYSSYISNVFCFL
ncbi:hypothetical protein CJD42_0240 [Campylobacter jejuni subsp. jejuni D42a]|nr:hypothetical protein CJS3_0050 [Campylobacter jejuni subsp. jejuni S3]APA80356.1 hypothetical protein CJD42_0240 [Campylobacter jejuni subsp. jejuni D42a]EFV08380.1 putative membrane protein [Campylobacter jejuni subsp. jejuni 305]